MSQSAFAPKQVVPITPELLNELQKNVSDEIAKQLPPLLPSLTAESHIHDEGCGTGAVTKAIMSGDPPSGLKIDATDKYGHFVESVTKLGEQNGWGDAVNAQVMDVSDLSGFADGTFSHSIANFVMMHQPKESEACSEIYRTLRDGGAAAITVWKSMPYMVAVHAAHRQTRGEGAPLGKFMAALGVNGEDLVPSFRKAGFKEDSVTVKSLVTEAVVEDLRRWITLVWTYLGHGQGGWKPEDEEKWDDAIAAAIETIKADKGYREENGVSYVTMVADVVLAVK